MKIRKTEQLDLDYCSIVKRKVTKKINPIIKEKNFDLVNNINVDVVFKRH